MGGMGGRNGFTLKDYFELSDRQIVILLSIDFDDEGRLITEAEEGGWEDDGEDDGQPTGRISRVMRELPEPASIGLDDATMQWALAIRGGMVPPYYLVLQWNLYKKHGLSDEECKKRWWDKMHSDN